jgi:hypothetical protein
LILDERGFDSFMTWAQRAKEFLQVYGDPPSPLGENLWREWGASLGLLSGIGVTPSPYVYSDWRRYVRALNLVVNPQLFRAWSTIPNFAKNGAFSVNVFTSYFVLPSTGWTLTLVGSLPTGWTFVSPNLAHAGAVLSGPNPISFKATFTNGLVYQSNTFTVQGI